MFECLHIALQVFGVAVAIIHTIEWQKRGLPHAHILVTLAVGDRFLTPSQIDSVICAELPPRGVEGSHERELYNCVVRNMMHGPCGADFPRCPCMHNNICCKKYPKEIRAETSISPTGWALYRRREIPQEERPIVRGAALDNTSVVPYNLWLLWRYDAHINVELCNSIAAMKYLHKYIHKGSDRAQVGFLPHGEEENTRDEVAMYRNHRWLTSSEASWRILAFPLHANTPAVYRLPVHLEGEQTVLVPEHTNLHNVVAMFQHTRLTGWFRSNRRDTNGTGHALLYTEYCRAYKWADHKWVERTQRKSGAIGRMYNVHPNSGERYYLRVLLGHLHGTDATSYTQLRSHPITGAILDTFREACVQRGLLQDDSEWENCLREACAYQMPRQLRELFATLLVLNNAQHPLELWNTFHPHLCDDILHRDQERQPGLTLQQQHIDECLRLISSLLQMHDKDLHNYNLPIPPQRTIRSNPEHSSIYADQLGFDVEALAAQVRVERALLQADQAPVYEDGMSIVNHGKGDRPSTVLFIDSPGGCGKTFLLNLMLRTVRSQGKIALAVATSGIASQLLDHGCTAHSRFKIPVKDICDISTCKLPLTCASAILIRDAALIVWDEAPMGHRHLFMALDRSLRDIKGAVDPAARNLLMGGIPFVLSGDHRQVLPIVRHGTRAETVEASIRHAHIHPPRPPLDGYHGPMWPLIAQHRLRINMRVQNAVGDAAVQAAWFAQWLLDVGSARHGESVRIPEHMLCPTNNPEDLITTIFGEIGVDLAADSQAYANRAILTTLNSDLATINQLALDRIPGQSTLYKSADSVSQDDANNYPVEYLHTLTPSGLPDHELRLKKGVPVMLLRNMGCLRLANGTRLLIKECGRNTITAEVMTGPRGRSAGRPVGDTVVIPRIELTCDDETLPVPFKRRQFPLRLAFCITINKSQGQTLSRVGLYLPTPVFAHGQLYTGVSRAGDPAALHIMTPEQPTEGHEGLGTYIINIVYQEALT